MEKELINNFSSNFWSNFWGKCNEEKCTFTDILHIDTFPLGVKIFLICLHMFHSFHIEFGIEIITDRKNFRTKQNELPIKSNCKKFFQNIKILVYKNINFNNFFNN